MLVFYYIAAKKGPPERDQREKNTAHTHTITKDKKPLATQRDTRTVDWAVCPLCVHTMCNDQCGFVTQVLSRPEGVWLREALFFCFFSFP